LKVSVYVPAVFLNIETHFMSQLLDVEQPSELMFLVMPTPAHLMLLLYNNNFQVTKANYKKEEI